MPTDVEDVSFDKRHVVGITYVQIPSIALSPKLALLELVDLVTFRTAHVVLELLRHSQPRTLD